MELKDLAVLIGVFSTFGLGVFNLYESRRTAIKTRFANIVTAQRLSKLDSLQLLLAEFMSLAQHIHSDIRLGHNSNEDLMKREQDERQLNQLYHRIQLSATGILSDDEDCLLDLADEVKSAVYETNGRRPHAMRDAIEYLTKNAQSLLIDAMQRIEEEALRGRSD